MKLVDDVLGSVKFAVVSAFVMVMERVLVVTLEAWNESIDEVVES